MIVVIPKGTIVLPKTKKTVAMAERKSARSTKPTPKFDWSPYGTVYESPEDYPAVKTLPNGNRVSLGQNFPKVSLGHSSIPRAGKGLFALQRILPRALITQYKGEIIALVDAIRLLDEVFIKLPSVPVKPAIEPGAYVTRDVLAQGKATHVKRIGDSIWCVHTIVNAERTYDWYADSHGLAGFANTKDSRLECNARFETIGDEVFLIATKPINIGDEIFAYYDRSAEIAIQKARKRAADERLARKGKKAKASSR